MNKGQSPEPLDFFIWTVEDVGLWLETINLGSYRQTFKEHGVNGEYLEGMSMFTTEQILRFIRRCHMRWGDFITLCKELRRIKDKAWSSLLQSFVSHHLNSLRKHDHARVKDQWISCNQCSIGGLSERGAKGAAAVVGTGMPIHSVLKSCKIQQTIKSGFFEAGAIDATQPLPCVYL
ncbi:hypothetical protein AHAS_Ahas17G0008500 [Arachis hypogaea]